MFNRKSVFMRTPLIRIALPLLAAGCLSLAWLPASRTVVYMIGDSTMADKAVTAYPETGWGMPFRDYFDSSVRIDNRAMNGRSTKSFLAEGRWKSVMRTLAPGDYVLIQFGHNDEVPTKKNHTTPEEFRANLEQFVGDSRRKGAQPVLLTPIGRRKFDPTGQLLDTHRTYAELVRAVAKENHVPLIDLDRESRQLIQSMGPERSKDLFNYLEPRENPHYPEGRRDDTHFSEWGARRMAEIVLRDLASLGLPLAKKINYVHPSP